MAITRRRRATRRRGKNRRGFVAIPFFTELPLSTLADNTVITASILTFSEDIFIISADVQANLNAAPGGQGPLMVGLAHGDLTIAEINEALDAEVTDPDDIIAKERARRPVRRVGVFPALSSDEVLAQGQSQRIVMRFSVGNDHALNMFCVNRSGGPLTGAAIVTFVGTLFGRWQR